MSNLKFKCYATYKKEGITETIVLESKVGQSKQEFINGLRNNGWLVDTSTVKYNNVFDWLVKNTQAQWAGIDTLEDILNYKDTQVLEDSRIDIITGIERMLFCKNPNLGHKKCFELARDFFNNNVTCFVNNEGKEIYNCDYTVIE